MYVTNSTLYLTFFQPNIYCLWLIAVEYALYNMNAGDAISTHTHTHTAIQD